MQSDRAHQTEAPTTASVFRRVAREDGYLGRGGLLTKGITATMGRNGAFNMVYFGLYHTVMVRYSCSPDNIFFNSNSSSFLPVA